MNIIKNLLVSSALLSAAVTSNATVIVFDNTADANYELASAANLGNPDAWGSMLGFTGFNVTGGYAASNVLTGASFSLSDITSTLIDQDSDPADGGLGVCSEAVNNDCSGSSDSFSSNTNSSNPGGDELLLFNFNASTWLQKVSFNGEHKPFVDGDEDGNYKDTDNALFNVFFSTDGVSYTSIFGSNGQQQPDGLKSFSISSGAHSFWAVAASGWGDHSSYIESLEYNQVPAPASIAMLSLGLIGLAAARRSSKSKS